MDPSFHFTVFRRVHPTLTSFHFTVFRRVQHTAYTYSAVMISVLRSLSDGLGLRGHTLAHNGLEHRTDLLAE